MKNIIFSILILFYGITIFAQYQLWQPGQPGIYTQYSVGLYGGSIELRDFSGDNINYKIINEANNKLHFKNSSDQLVFSLSDNDIHIHNPFNNKRIGIGFENEDNFGFLSCYNYGSIGDFQMFSIYASKVGIGTDIETKHPIQELDLWGRLNIRNGVIQNGTTAINNTTDLGLYSQTNDTWMRFVTNQGDIRFYTNGNINPIGDGVGSVIFHHNGNVGIGITTETPDPNYKLSVNGQIKSKGIRVQSNWYDFVFKPDYRLMNLGELNSYIKENGHLPDIPTEGEVRENGIELGEIASKLLQKVEELTLYVIQQNNEIDKLKNENAEIKSLLNK